MVQDASLAFRSLRKSLGSSLLSVAILGMTIGVTTSVYAVINAAIAVPGIGNPDRLLNIYHSDSGTSGSLLSLSWPDFEDLGRLQSSFSNLAAWTRVRSVMVASGGTTLFLGEAVNGAYFNAVEAGAALGRVVVVADDSAGARPVLVLGYDTWRGHFGGDPSVVGQVVRLGSASFEIVGVASSSFRGSQRPGLEAATGWITFAGYATADPSWAEQRSDRELRNIRVRGRVAPGVSNELARAEVSRIAALLDRAAPIGDGRSRGPRNKRYWATVPVSEVLIDETVSGFARSIIAVVVGLLGLVAVIASSNLVALTLARGEEIKHRVAIRAALGGHGWRLLSEPVLGGLMLAIAGTLLGLLMARVALVFLAGNFRIAPTVVFSLMPVVDIKVVVFAALVGTVSFAVFAVIPAARLLKGASPARILAGRSGAVAPGWGRGRPIIAAQVFVSAACLGIAALCGTWVLHVTRAGIGVDLERLVFVELDLSASRYDDQRARLARLELLKAPIRGTYRTEVASALPMGLVGPEATVRRLDGAGEAGTNKAQLVASGAALFEVLGVGLIDGRAFRDSQAGEPEVVLSAAAARRLFGRERAVGHRVAWRQHAIRGEGQHQERQAVVVGVAADTGALTEDSRGSTTMYVPFATAESYRRLVIVSRGDDPRRLPDELKAVAGTITPDLVINQSGNGRNLMEPSTLLFRTVGALAFSLGGFAFLLVAVGLYGVLNHTVTSRRRELGIRIALGASPGRVARLITSQMLWPLSIGIAGGMCAVVLVRTCAASMFWNSILASEPLVLLFVPATMVSVGLCASYWPARRAGQIDPVEALRCE